MIQEVLPVSGPVDGEAFEIIGFQVVPHWKIPGLSFESSGHLKKSFTLSITTHGESLSCDSLSIDSPGSIASVSIPRNP
ncbi:hypothetical protein VTL71DRAFT_13931 [Oculimacula yallundae]|uniref:Uncharacterized protein n=1 Tax=Oculimacula yallundae TaxID=86028 RepID=A0ABR4CLU4_9HELO